MASGGLRHDVPVLSTGGGTPAPESTTLDPPQPETPEKRARRLFDEMARNIGREAVNHLKTMYPHILTDAASLSKSWELSLTNHIRNDFNYRMKPLLMAMITMQKEWQAELEENER